MTDLDKESSNLNSQKHSEQKREEKIEFNVEIKRSLLICRKMIKEPLFFDVVPLRWRFFV